jgi:hypothetical protein
MRSSILATAVTVYDHPLSPCGQQVKSALIEKDVAFEAPLPGTIGSGDSCFIDPFSA